MILDHHQFVHRLFNTIFYNGNIYDILKLSRINNIDFNSLEYNGQSLIHLCCLYNRFDLLKFFVEFGKCNILIMNRDGWLPLHIAIYLGHMNIVLYLLECIQSN